MITEVREAGSDLRLPNDRKAAFRAPVVRRSRLPSGLFCAAAALVLAGCSPDVTGSVHTLDGIIYGRVTDASGAPVAGARIFARHFRPGCSGILADEETGETTNGAGNYRLRFNSLGGLRDESCLLLHAEAGPRKSVPVRFEVQLRTQDEPLDSVQVNVLMPDS